MPARAARLDQSHWPALGALAGRCALIALGVLPAAACAEAPDPPAAADAPVEAAAATQSIPLTSLCASAGPECATYLPIWRDLVMARGGIDAAWFDAHVVPLAASIDTWNDGRSLRVRYRLTIDWASFEREDVMVVFVNPSAAPYPSLGVPLGTPLDASQIARAASGSAWGTAIATIARVDALRFRSQNEALAALRALPDGGTLQAEDISLNRPGMMPRENGHPHLHARSPERPSSDRCSRGMIDLVTGEAQVTVDACRMTGGAGGRGVVP